MSYIRATAKRADGIAATVRKFVKPALWTDEGTIRDTCDYATGCEMTCVQLDCLTDMVVRRLRRV